jgi:hypothetical protein
MPQFEYDVITIEPPSNIQLQKILEERGKQGWQLVDSFGNSRFVFAREIKTIGPTEFKTFNESDIAPL